MLGSSRYLVSKYARLCILRVKRVDVSTHQHMRQYEVLEHLEPLRTTRLIIVAESLEKVNLGRFPLFC